jgi:hypothetical protein
LVDAFSFVLQVNVDVVEDAVATSEVICGAVTSLVVKVHVDVLEKPPKKLLDPSLNAVPGTVT